MNAIELLPVEYRDEYTLALRYAFLNKKISGMVHKNNDSMIYLSRIVPIIHNGSVISVMTISTDITEQRLAEDKIRRLNTELENRVEERTKQLLEANDRLNSALEKEKELGELKTRFISIVSHEYRTPLAVILASTYLLDKFHEIGDIIGFEKHRDRIRISVDAMTHLIDDVVLIGGGKDGKLSFKPRTFNARKLFDDIIEEEKALDNYKHNFTFDNRLDNDEIFSDSRLIRLILCNLISNARKFSSDGSDILIEAENKSCSLKFSISDKGIGIPQEVKDNIFDTFSRQKQDIGIIQGIGIGLSIVKKCVDVMNGGINWSSERNKGTVFVIELP
jgi:signal transduction histidine kinase